MKNDAHTEQTDSRKLPTHTKRKRGRLRSIILGLIILVCGFVLGSGTTIVVVHKHVVRAFHEPEKAPERIVKRLRRKLDLSDEQAGKVQAIIAKRQKALIAIFLKALPDIDKELTKTREEVAKVLNPEQAEHWRKRFDTMYKKWMPRPKSIHH